MSSKLDMLHLTLQRKPLPRRISVGRFGSAVRGALGTNDETRPNPLTLAVFDLDVRPQKSKNVVMKLTKNDVLPIALIILQLYAGWRIYVLTYVHP